MDSTQNQSLEIPSDVRSYLETLLQDAGMTTLDADMHEEMIKELFVRLDNYIISVIIDNLPPEHLETFTKMNDEKRPKQEIEQFLKEKITNTQDVFSRAFMEFRDLYLGNVTVARNAPEEKGEQNTAKTN